MTDTKRVQQVLKNLLSNAFKFTSRTRSASASRADRRLDAGPARARSASSVVAFEVSDTGIGIPPDKQRSSSRPSSRRTAARAASTAAPGSGLAISREIRPTAGRRDRGAHRAPASAARSPSTCRSNVGRDKGGRDPRLAAWKSSTRLVRRAIAGDRRPAPMTGTCWTRVPDDRSDLASDDMSCSLSITISTSPASPRDRARVLMPQGPRRMRRARAALPWRGSTARALRSCSTCSCRTSTVGLS